MSRTDTAELEESDSEDFCLWTDLWDEEDCPVSNAGSIVDYSLGVSNQDNLSSVGGGDLLSLICPELGVAPRIDPGTDLEDELSTLADSPAAADHGVAPLSAPADVDIDLEQVFGDVGSLPAMVTPVCDFDGLIVAQPPMVTSPAGLTVVSPGFMQPSSGLWAVRRYQRRFRRCPRRRRACCSRMLR